MYLDTFLIAFSCGSRTGLMVYSVDNGVQTQKEKSIDDWLPITSSRNAKWWYSAFHNVTAMVGAGVLSLPYAMSELGWYVLVIDLFFTTGLAYTLFDLSLISSSILLFLRETKIT